MWSYKSSEGVFTIFLRNDGRYVLNINSEYLGSYHSAEAAADDVYTCSTGYYEWDKLAPVEEPCDLTEWVSHK